MGLVSGHYENVSISGPWYKARITRGKHLRKVGKHIHKGNLWQNRWYWSAWDAHEEWAGYAPTKTEAEAIAAVILTALVGGQDVAALKPWRERS